MRTIQYNSIYYENPVIINVGQNAQDNWDTLDIYHKLGQGWWFHLKSFPSPHVFVQTDNLTKDLVEYAGRICKERSKYKMVRYPLVVSYTKCNNVVKDGGLGSVSFRSNRRVKEIKIT